MTGQVVHIPESCSVLPQAGELGECERYMHDEICVLLCCNVFFLQAIRYATDALGISATSSKAYFRRAAAYEAKKDYDKVSFSLTLRHMCVMYAG